METNDGLTEAEDILQMFYGLKEIFKQEVEEKEKLRQKLDFIEENSEWSKTNVQQLREQLSQYKTCIESQQNSLNQIKQIQDLNNELNEKILALNTSLKTNEELHQTIVDKITSEMSSEIEDLNRHLSEKEKAILDLNLTISSKDILLSQSKRELADNKIKSDENIEEIKNFYEKKIQSIYKEFDDKCKKIYKQNDEKIIEIRANCMRSVDKTKDEYDTKLCKSHIQYKELEEKYTHLRLEFEAMKMPNNFSKNNKTLAPKPKSANQSNQNKSKLKIQPLDSDEDISDSMATKSIPNQLGQSANPTQSKRKKLVPSNDSYLDFVRDD